MTNGTTMTFDPSETGIDGSGRKVWTVFVMRGTRTVAMHRFYSESEAACWVKWA